MPISFLPSRDAVPHSAVFGKLPGNAEFVRAGQSAHPAVQEFDGAIARSISARAARQVWDEARALAAGPSAFQFTTHDRRWCFFGALQPSRDAAGRFYPLAAGIILPAYAVAPYGPELAVANETYFEEMRQAVAHAARTGDISVCRRCLADWSAGSPLAQDGLAMGGRLLERHLARTPAYRLRTLLGEGFSSNTPDAPTLTDTLLAFIFYAAQMRQDGGRGDRPAFPLPLSAGPGEAALDMAAWLALYRAAGGNKYFPDFAVGSILTLAPGRLGGHGLGAFWGVGGITPGIPANAPWRRHPAWARPVDALARCIQDPGTDLASVRSMLEMVAGYAK
jgi:type VI secretion system protein ImpM